MNQTVYISNLSEDVWQFIQALNRKSVRRAEIEENATILSNRDLFAFSGQDNITLILPAAVDPEFLAYYLDLFGNKNLKILVTKKHSGETCRDILEDQELMIKIKQMKKINLVAYSTTPQFLKLVRNLRKQGVEILTPESPEENDSWIVNFYGSKSGFRQLGLKMAKGLIVWGIEEAGKIAMKLYQEEGGVVIKTNKGHAGMGLIILHPEDSPKKLQERFKAEGYWNKFPIVIEKYIQPDMTICGGFPNMEMKIGPDGKAEILYFCRMRVIGDGIFRGIEIHKEVISGKVKKQAEQLGCLVGEQYRKAGYKGYFELDFVAGKDGEIYLTESNIRRTGGTHVYHTARVLFGKYFMNQVYTLSNNIYEFSWPKAPKFNEFKERLSSVLFDRKTREGLIITAANWLNKNKFGYIIFGKTKDRAEGIENELIDLLQKRKD